MNGAQGRVCAYIKMLCFSTGGGSALTLIPEVLFLLSSQTELSRSLSPLRVSILLGEKKKEYVWDHDNQRNLVSGVSENLESIIQSGNTLAIIVW